MEFRDVIIEFFTGKLGKEEALFVVSGICLVIYLIFRILPVEKAIKLHRHYRHYDWENEYDAHQTAKNTRTLALIFSLYFLLLLIIGYIFGEVAMDIGMWLFLPLAIVLIVKKGKYAKQQ